jgi:hypothetical protein
MKSPSIPFASRISTRAGIKQQTGRFRNTSSSLSTSACNRVSRNSCRANPTYRTSSGMHTCAAWDCFSDDAVPEARASTVARARDAAVLRIKIHLREQCHRLAKEDAGTYATHAAARRAEAAHEAALPPWPTCALTVLEGVLDLRHARSHSVWEGSSLPRISPRCIIIPKEH